MVDIAIVASVVALCFVPSVSPMAWNVLGQIALVRFGVAVTKQALGGGGNGGGGGGGNVSNDRDGAKRKDSVPPSSDAHRTLLRFAWLRFAWPAVLVFVVYVAVTLHLGAAALAAVR